MTQLFAASDRSSSACIRGSATMTIVPSSVDISCMPVIARIAMPATLSDSRLDGLGIRRTWDPTLPRWQPGSANRPVSSAEDPHRRCHPLKIHAMSAALITGASTGLGREFARLFAADGVDVVIVSSERSTEQLAALAEELRARDGVRVDAITMDLSVAGAGADLVTHVDKLGVEVEYLVNNAGVGILGLKAQDCAPDAVSQLVQLNVVTLTDLTVLYLGRMVKARRGSILNVSSVAAYVVPHGLEAAYAASQAFIRSFSESVAYDLRGTGVTCTHLAPCPTTHGSLAATAVFDERFTTGQSP